MFSKPFNEVMISYVTAFRITQQEVWNKFGFRACILFLWENLSFEAEESLYSSAMGAFLEIPLISYLLRDPGHCSCLPFSFDLISSPFKFLILGWGTPSTSADRTVSRQSASRPLWPPTQGTESKDILRCVQQ